VRVAIGKGRSVDDNVEVGDDGAVMYQASQCQSASTDLGLRRMGNVL